MSLNKRLARRRKGKKRQQRKRQGEEVKPETVRRRSIEVMERLPLKKKIQLLQNALRKLEAKYDVLWEKARKGQAYKGSVRPYPKGHRIYEDLNRITSAQNLLGYTLEEIAPFNQKIAGKFKSPAELLFEVYGMDWKAHTEKADPKIRKTK